MTDPTLAAVHYRRQLCPKGQRNITPTQAQGGAKMTELKAAVLVTTLKIGMFGGTATDQKATEEVRVAEGIKEGVKPGRYAKNLLRGWFEYDQYRSWRSRARSFFSKMTLPYEGSRRLLPMELYFDFVTEMNKLKAEGTRRIKVLETEYEDQVKQEQGRLAGLYDPDNYPTKEEFVGKFYLAINHFPLPEGSSLGAFVDTLGEEAAADLEASVNAGISGALASAQGALVKNVRSILTHLGEVAAQAEPKVYQSLLNSVGDLINVLPKQNIMKDENLTKLFAEIKTKFSGLTRDDLKKEDKVRAKAKADVDAILAKMTGM